MKVDFNLITKYHNYETHQLYEDNLNEEQIKEYQQWVNTRDDVEMEVNPIYVDRGLNFSYERFKEMQGIQN